MSIEVKLVLTCERCPETCEALAPLVGKKTERLRVDASSASLPTGWWLGRRGDGHGYGTTIGCACPKHAKAVRGF